MFDVYQDYIIAHTSNMKILHLYFNLETKKLVPVGIRTRVIGFPSKFCDHFIIRASFHFLHGKFKTSRDRPKSAPYPRLQNSKKTSKCQVFSFTVLENRSTKKLHTQKNGPSGAPGLAKVSQCRKTERGDPLRFFNIHSVAKHEKIEENKIFYFRKKISQCRKNRKGGPFGIFQHPFCRKTSKKCRGTLWGKFFFEKKFRSAEKNERGTLWSRPVWYVTRKNRKNLFGSVR